MSSSWYTIFYMKHQSDSAKDETLYYIEEAAQVAKQATCQRSKCGSIVVKYGEVIGEGFNSPPYGLESQRRCEGEKNDYSPKVTDKTCCVHAEQRAIMDALRRNAEKILGSRLYFIRLNENGEKEFAGAPYCTICSKMALDVGIEEFVLWHQEGIRAYGIQEYNTLSYAYQS